MYGQTMNFKKYNEYVSKMKQPVLPSNLPKGQFDFKGLCGYAKEKGVAVSELSEIEKKMFIRLEEEVQ